MNKNTIKIIIITFLITAILIIVSIYSVEKLFFTKNENIPNFTTQEKTLDKKQIEVYQVIYGDLVSMENKSKHYLQEAILKSTPLKTNADFMILYNRISEMREILVMLEKSDIPYEFRKINKELESNLGIWVKGIEEVDQALVAIKEKGDIFALETGLDLLTDSLDKIAILRTKLYKLLENVSL